MAPLRTPLQGVWNVVRFNWHFYLVAGGAALVLAGLGLADAFDTVIVSREVGCSKPEPRIYALALEQLGVQAAQTLFVGDSPLNDVAGPQSAGMKAALFPGGHALPGHIRPDYVLTDLRGVLGIVEPAP